MTIRYLAKQKCDKKIKFLHVEKGNPFYQISLKPCQERHREQFGLQIEFYRQGYLTYEQIFYQEESNRTRLPQVISRMLNGWSLFDQYSDSLFCLDISGSMQLIYLKQRRGESTYSHLQKQLCLYE